MHPAIFLLIRGIICSNNVRNPLPLLATQPLNNLHLDTPSQHSENHMHWENSQVSLCAHIFKHRIGCFGLPLEGTSGDVCSIVGQANATKGQLQQ